MNGEIEEEAPRPRPLSSGIWTLFSWLRRSDKYSSSESISSVGSDRTVASFDFLAPIQYKDNPAVVLPQIPETETYKKRLNERNLRRKYDRDITLRRKYGLFREEVSGFDGFSLPHKRIQRNSPTRRDRRATSEIFHRRAPYVPGKRRAPLPPQTVVSNTLPRSYKRKRQAPKPPLKQTITDENKENVNNNKNIQMEPKSTNTKYTVTKNIESVNQALETKSKDTQTKDVKLRSEKSFIKQIFDNRKRNSAIDTSHVKLLPSISELDKQAAEIIATNKFTHGESSGQNGEFYKLPAPPLSNEKRWICKLCFRKYDASIVSCLYCITSDRNRKIASNIYTSTQTENVGTDCKNNEIDEKKKLKEMLKEMKDSLPKKPKHSGKILNKDKVTLSSTETPTLRIGAPIENISEIVQPLSSTDCDTRNKKPVEIGICHNSQNVIAKPSTSIQNTCSVVGNSSKDTNKTKNVDENLNNDTNSDNTRISITNSRKYNFLLGSEPKPTINLITKQPSDKVLLTDNSKSNELNDKKQLPDVSEVRTKITIYKQPPNSALQTIKLGEVATEPEKKNSNDKNVMITNKNTKPTEISNDKHNSSSNTQTKICVKETNKNKPVTATQQNIEKLKKQSNFVKETKMERIRLGDVILQDTNEIVPNAKLNTPLRISSLLNPLYCPKTESSTKATVKENLQTKPNIICKNNGVINSTLSDNIFAPSSSKTSSEIHNTSTSKKLENDLLPGNKLNSETSVIKSIINIDNVSLHAKRRDFINQLESAIAKGDEKTAAEAAANLAKLKISCSVLSFSSQIIGLNNNVPKDTKNIENNTQDNARVSKSDDLKEIKKENSKQLSITEPITVNDPQPSTSKKEKVEETVPIKIWVEDKEAARGPIIMQVKRKAVMGDLKRQTNASLGLDIRLQRWIVGKNLCTNDDAPLITLAGPDFKAPFYLCLVDSGTNKDDASKISDISNSDNKNVPNKINNQELGDVYAELMKLEQLALVPNTEDFECGVCIEQCEAGNGAVLRECIHTFCRECLSDVVRHCEEATVSCPAIGCPGTLQEREIRALLTQEEYDRWLGRSLTAVESGNRNTFHCRTRDCSGWAFCEPGVRRFPCPVCNHINCLPCQAVHENETCEGYQAKLRKAAIATEGNQRDEGTRALLDSLIAKGEALECPECCAIITKKWGCDWIKCSSCKTEICWVTKGRRWGPAGKGDISGGCRCGLEGKRCHPLCAYCH